MLYNGTLYGFLLLTIYFTVFVLYTYRVSILSILSFFHGNDFDINVQLSQTNKELHFAISVHGVCVNTPLQVTADRFEAIMCENHSVVCGGRGLEAAAAGPWLVRAVIASEKQ